MNNDEKIIRLLVKLNKETSEKKITWDLVDPPKELFKGTEFEVFSYYQTIYSGRYIGIYERRYKHYVDFDEYHWSSKIIFAVLDTSERVLWDYSERTPALKDLYEAIKIQTADLDELLGEMLNE